MTSLLRTALTISAIVLLSHTLDAAPKVTQAALGHFKANDVRVVAVEEFGKPLRLLFVGRDKETIYSTSFTEGSNNREYAYVNPFLRFRSYDVPGLPSPVIVAVAVSPGGSDVGYEIKLIAERNGKITTLNPEPIDLTIQDGLYLGYINATFGHGMVIWENRWENEAHYDPHRYAIRIYRWDTRSKNFRLARKFTTKAKFRDGCSATRSYGLPCRELQE